MLKAAEFYIGYVTRGPSPDVQIHGKVALGDAPLATVPILREPLKP